MTSDKGIRTMKASMLDSLTNRYSDVESTQQIVRKNAVLSDCPFSSQNTVFHGDLVETASHGSVRLYSEDRTLKR